MKYWFYTLIFLCVPSALAQETIIDEDFPAWCCVGYYLDYPGDYMAQTFTLGHSGQLVEVGIHVGLSGYSFYNPPIDDLLVRLVGTNAEGSPEIENLLAEKQYGWTEVPTFSTSETRYLDFDVSAWDIQVSAGDVLAIVLSSNQTAYSGPNNTRLRDHFNYTWHTSLYNPYAGGDFYLYSPNLLGPVVQQWQDRPSDPNAPPFPEPTRDMGFQTLVRVPEPSTLSLLLVFVVLRVNRVGRIASL